MTGAIVLAGAPTADLEPATKKYTDDADALKLDLTGGTLSGPLLLPATAPTFSLQAVTKDYVDTKVSGFSSGDWKADGSVTATGNFNMGGHKIQGVVNGVLDTDVMTKGYIDGEVAYV